jgi:hypothetical protein
MRGSSVVEKPSVTVIDEAGVERVVCRAEEKRREKDLRRLVGEKMKGGSIVSPTVSPKLAKAMQKSVKAEEEQRRRDDAARSKPRPATAKTSTEKKLEVAAGSGEKKMNALRRQFSKLNLGRLLQRKDDRKAYGKMVEDESAAFDKNGVIEV